MSKKQHRGTGGGSSRRAPARPAGSRGRIVLRTWLLFIVVFGALMGLLNWQESLLVPRINAATGQVTAWLLWIMGAEGHAEGPLVSSSMGRMSIIWECTGVTPIAVFVAAVLAYPCRWRRKLPGIVAGVAILLAVNQVRLLSLMFIQYRFPSFMDVAHLYVWQSLLIFISVILWMIWVVKSAHRDDPSAS